jgi:hypothetical protein
MFGMSFQVLFALAAVGSVVVFMSMARLKAALLIYGAFIFAASITAPSTPMGILVPTVITPLQTNRANLYLATGVLMALAALFHAGKLKVGSLPGVGMVMLAIGLYAGFVRVIASDNPMGGLQTILFVLGTTLPVLLVASAMLDDEEDALLGMRLIALVSAAWIVCCVAQFFVRRNVLTITGVTRFQGMLANPQHAGAYLALMSWVCLFLFMEDVKLRYRPIWLALTIVNSLMLLWTGSRTGLGMFAVGSMAIFYVRIGRAILFLPVLGGLFALGLEFIRGDLGGTLGLEVIGGRGDTRSYAWGLLWEQFLENPVFGTGAAEETRFSENSVLFGLATYGMFMGLIIAALFVAAAVTAMKIWRARPFMTPLERRLGDAYLGFMAMYFAGSMFEGYMVSRVSTPLALLLFFSCIGPFLLRRVRDRQIAEAFADPSDTRTRAELAEYGDFSDYGSDTRTLSDSQTHGDTRHS